MARFREERIPWDSQPQEAVALAPEFVPKYFWSAPDGGILRGQTTLAAGTQTGTQTATSAGRAVAHNGTSQLENWVINEPNSGYPIIVGGSFVVTQTSTAVQSAVGVGGATLSGGLYGGVGQYTANRVSSWLRVQTGVSDASIDGPTAVIGQRYNVVRVSRSATDHVMYVNGVRYSGSTSSGTPNDSWLNFSVGASVRATTPVFYGRQSVHMGFFDRVDPGEEWMREWSLNEGSIFEPQSIPVYVAGAGGASLNLAASALALTGTVAATGDLQYGVGLSLSASALAVSGAVAVAGDLAYLVPSLDLSASPLALSGTLAPSVDIQIGTAFDLAASALSLAGTASLSGDIQITTAVVLDLAVSPLSISGAFSLAGDVAFGSSFDLAAGTVSMTGTLSASGDVQSSEEPLPNEATSGGRGAVTGFTRFRSSPREPLPPIIEPSSDDELMAEVQEVLAVLFSLEVFT